MPTSSSLQCGPVRAARVSAPRHARRTVLPVAEVSGASVHTQPRKLELPPLQPDIRSQFPILHQMVNGKPLVYLDNAATSQKPLAVINALSTYYSAYNSNVHRGVHTLAAKATTEFEAARDKVARFINAASHREIVFLRNASEAINLLANTWGLQNIQQGDEIILSVAEHHSNLVPWQMLAARTGAVLKFVELTDTQQLDMQHYKQLLSPRTKLVSLVHVSNVLGCVLDTSFVAEEAHKVGAKVLLDCCQSVPNMPVNVRALGADWIVGSSHKMCGPSGVGFLWGKYELLETMNPWMGGGEMIQEVELTHSTYALPPTRFEAGTPAIAEAIGLGAAVDYLSGLGMDRIHSYEQDLGGYMYERLSALPDLTIYGPSPKAAGPRGRAALCAFNVTGLHATDISALLDASGVAIRTGHHCTQPLNKYLGISASARASAYIYNTSQEVDVFVDTLNDTIQFFREL